MRRCLLWAMLAALAGCPSPSTDMTDPTDVTDETDEPDPPVPDEVLRRVTVTLDGNPVPGAMVIQGGTGRGQLTDVSGRVDVGVDLTLDGDHALMASHPNARIGWVRVDTEAEADVTIALTSYDPTDNQGYTFQDPGEPDRRDTTLQCAHCHVTLNQDWFGSPHRTAASNPILHDLYGGASAAIADAAACANAGGTWAEGATAGGGRADQCFIGSAVLQDLSTTCGSPPCAETAENRGGCADCHAPGIDGAVGGRGLHEATGFAFDYGVHCDVCHKVDQVHLDDDAPGVAGRLAIHRPIEDSPSDLLGEFAPLQFGPSHDQPNPRMGSVQRDHFRDGSLCAGCHEYTQPALVPGTTLDAERWPDGQLPVHSTFTEWREGPFGDRVPCNACHMPPAPEVLNAADFQLFQDGNDPGVVAGWIRPPGAVRHHSWVGPRTPTSRMLPLSAALDVHTSREGDALTITATTTNVGAGHRLPTGEPSRALVLHVQATCDGTPQPAIGGDAIPLFVGSRATQDAAGDWSVWPEARVGDEIRVLSQDGWIPYDGFGPFGDGSFTGPAAGLPRSIVVGTATVTAVDAEGRITLDRALPTGDLAVLGDRAGQAAQAGAVAGAPGFAFARVLADTDGRLMVPHHQATDMRSDNRLAPHQAFNTTHRFRVACDDPQVRAQLTYRAHPVWLANEKRWDNPDILVQEVVR